METVTKKINLAVKSQTVTVRLKIVQKIKGPLFFLKRQKSFIIFFILYTKIQVSLIINPLSDKLTKWSNTLKHFVGSC